MICWSSNSDASRISRSVPPFKHHLSHAGIRRGFKVWEEVDSVELADGHCLTIPLFLTIRKNIFLFSFLFAIYHPIFPANWSTVVDLIWGTHGPMGITLKYFKWPLKYRDISRIIHWNRGEESQESSVSSPDTVVAEDFEVGKTSQLRSRPLLAAYWIHGWWGFIIENMRM